jgi:hypothetical protein
MRDEDAAPAIPALGKALDDVDPETRKRAHLALDSTEPSNVEF